MKKVNILRIDFDSTDIVEAVAHGIRLMEEHRQSYLLAPGYDTVLETRYSKKLRRALQGAEMILPSGKGLVAASHVLGSPIRSLIPGELFASALLARMSDLGMSVYLVGEGYTTERAAQAIHARFPGLVLAGTSDLRLASDERVAEVINSVSPDLLLVGLDEVRQELWIARNRERVNAGLIAGLGDTLYKLAGEEAPAEKKRPTEFLKVPEIVFAALWGRISGTGT